MSDLDVVKMRLRERETRFAQQVGMAKSHKQAMLDAGEEVEALKQRLMDSEKVIVMLQSFADERQSHVQANIEKLVTHGLHAVFEEDWSFHIVSVNRGAMAAMDFVIRSKTPKGDVVETSVLDSRGGGVAAVAGFILRLVLLLLSGRPVVLWLDETFAQLSAEYEPRLADFLRELVDKMHAQVVMVTHSDAYNDAADIVYRFKVVDGETKVERLDS